MFLYVERFRCNSRSNAVLLLFVRTVHFCVGKYIGFYYNSTSSSATRRVLERKALRARNFLIVQFFRMFFFFACESSTAVAV